MVTYGDDGFSPDDLYDHSPAAHNGYGPDEGYNTIVRLNDPRCSRRPRSGPGDPRIPGRAVQRLVRPAQEQLPRGGVVHPQAAHRDGGRGGGHHGQRRRLPDSNRHIGTFVINHDATLAKSIMRALIIEDGAQAGQMIHKEPDAGG